MKRLWIGLAILSSICFTAQAQEETSQDIRGKGKIAAHVYWSPAHIPFPNALGANVYFIANEKWQLGYDYLSSGRAIGLFSFKVGEISENSHTLLARRFFGNSFNLLFGAGQRTLTAKLPNNLLDLATTEYSLTAAELQTRYARIGVGNQWHFKKHYTFAVDWLILDIPFSGEVITSSSQFASSPSNTDTIRTTENILKYFPSFALVQMNFGVVF
ncbi:MAG: hypothetical protein OEZ43_09365 [Gammaproteobacteria bacterium]|nr:hypothetical protein [Gammaproteobacteria bacterium]